MSDHFEYPDSLYGPSPAFTGAGNQCFAMHSMQSQIASAQREETNMNQIGSTSQTERLGTLSPDEDEKESYATMNLDSCASTPLPLSNFGFGHSATVSGQETVFEFRSNMNIDLDLPMGEFPAVGDWFAPGYPSVYAVPSIMGHIYTGASQLQQNEPEAWLGQCSICEDQNTNDWADLILYPQFADRPLNQDYQDQKKSSKLLTDSGLDMAEYCTVGSTILPSSQGAPLRKASQKGPPLKDDQSDASEHAELLNGRFSPHSGEEKPLACPFYKRDPKQYAVCGKYKLRRIKDVKQHIYRLHCNPEFYCPRCRLKFECFSERDHHIRDGGCTRIEEPNRDGVISQDQRMKLRDYGSRGTSKHHQWKELWKVVFPGIRPPRSPHVEDSREELMSCLRSYWESNAEDIITGSLGKHDSERWASSLIKDIVSNIFHHFEASNNSWGFATNGEGYRTSQLQLVSEDSTEYTPATSPRDLDCQDITS
ncbi:hypothetical protein F5Y14DRAFT_446929 [Nemania sp. NC0429]|nr:hypothetical protein F5Y14DRAFT_446929 [Nemania sp. NC0429]